MERERLGSRLGFILLSAGCAIGCGNVWKFPWMCGQYGGGGFVLIYILCLLLLGLPVMTMEFAVGRAAQASPIRMYQKLERKGQKWHLHGYVAFFGNIALMAFYTVVTGWIIYYFVKFLTGQTENLGFVTMITNPGVNVTYLAVTVIVAFGILCFNLQGGLERITKYMMTLLMVLMVVLAIHSATLSGAAEGLKFYLVPDFSKITGTVIVGAMNQAFFTLSVGMGSMAIFGSYIGKERSLLGDSANVMATVFNHMAGGRWWGSLFFLFMVFAAMSTVLAVCENILAMVREMTGWKRPLGCLVCGAGVFVLALTTALGYSVFKFQPFADGSAWLDFWDFLVSNNILPLGSLVFTLYCCNKFGWGWDNFLAEANEGKGWKVKAWMKPIFRYLVPAAIIFIYIYGMVTFGWK